MLCKLLLAVASRVAEHGLQGLRASVAVAPGLWQTGLVVVALGLVAPQQVGSSQTRDRTHVPCIGRQILNRWTTREVLVLASDLWFIL